jgi:acyl-CoA thioesterase-1
MLRLILVAGLLLPVASRGAEDPVILVLGDSLSAGYGLSRQQGWVSLLAARLAESSSPYRVVNASVSGETTAGGLTRLGPLLKREPPAVLVVALGANDGLRGIAFGEIESNLTRLVRMGQEAGARILLAGIRLPPNYGAAYTEGFQAIFPAVARQEDVALVPHLLAGVAERWELMQADGLHPSAEAQPLILDNVWAELEPLLRDAE